MIIAIPSALKSQESEVGRLLEGKGLLGRVREVLQTKELDVVVWRMLILHNVSGGRSVKGRMSPLASGEYL